METVKSLAFWSLAAFVCAVASVHLWYADEIIVVFLQVIVVPWIVGPAAVAALLVTASRSTAHAWSYFAAEVTAILSTAACWIALFVTPDGQNGIALLVLPIAQFVLLGPVVLVLGYRKVL